MRAFAQQTELRRRTFVRGERPGFELLRATRDGIRYRRFGRRNPGGSAATREQEDANQPEAPLPERQKTKMSHGDSTETPPGASTLHTKNTPPRQRLGAGLANNAGTLPGRA